MSAVATLHFGPEVAYLGVLDLVYGLAAFAADIHKFLA
jgi:hypothetical protein